MEKEKSEQEKLRDHNIVGVGCCGMYYMFMGEVGGHC